MENVKTKIIRLPALSRPELLKLWKDLFGKPIHGSLRREILIPCIAYRLQENAAGGPSPKLQSELQRFQYVLRNQHLRAIKPGTRLVRVWKGEMHEVLVSESGYEYRGTIYKSLSVIARTITHTRWSGPAFFGLKKQALSSKERP